MEKDLKNPVWFKWPPWARWIATDSNGMTFVYEDKPIADLDKMGWSRAKTEEGQVGRIEYVYRDTFVTDNWMMTLKENPNKAGQVEVLVSIETKALDQIQQLNEKVERLEKELAEFKDKVLGNQLKVVGQKTINTKTKK